MVFAKDKNSKLVLAYCASAGVLIVGTLAEDVLTGGAGISDDAASIAAASEFIRKAAKLYPNAS